MKPLFIPEDNGEFLAQFKGTNGGVCGPACLATAGETSIDHILNRWLGKGRSVFRGFSPIAEIKEMLTLEGWCFKYLRGGKAKQFPQPQTKMAIVRIQWLQEDGTEYYWRAAGSHTHYVLMQKVEGQWLVFCNETGWFKAHGDYARNYLEGRGFVSSYLEIWKPQQSQAKEWP